VTLQFAVVVSFLTLQSAIVVSFLTLLLSTLNLQFAVVVSLLTMQLRFLTLQFAGVVSFLTPKFAIVVSPSASDCIAVLSFQIVCPKLRNEQPCLQVKGSALSYPNAIS